jgi:hypothetical protein
MANDWSRSKSDHSKRSTSWVSDVLIPQVVAFVAFVLFPAAVTAMAPVTWVTFTRDGDMVSAKAAQCLFFIVPYRTQAVSPVEGVWTSLSAGVMVPNTTGATVDDRQRETRTEDEAHLEMNGPGQKVTVMVSPVDVEQVHERVKVYLADARAPSLRLFAVANWKASVFVGGPLTLLAVFYFVCLALKLARKAASLFTA